MFELVERGAVCGARLGLASGIRGGVIPAQEAPQEAHQATRAVRDLIDSRLSIKYRTL
ncbi:MAG TPA: hypothetical protein VK871_12410 [Candidatus Limnocylindrales bacterium]|nr:hypothetical protein [Candidatus Limnocylindrales bacterium]